MSPSPKSGVTNQSKWRLFLYGGISSCIAEGVTFPLDTAKTRLQVQGQQASHMLSTGISLEKKQYRGLFDVLLRIPKEEGLRVLYRGLEPALLRQGIYGSIKFGIYYNLKKALTGEEENVGSNILCAVFAGMISSAIANPTDVLKVKMQIATSKTSMFSLFKNIYQMDGLRGLWRGVGPTAQRAGIIAGVELPVYDACKSYFIRHDIMVDSTPNHLSSSFIASFVTCLASTPNDVIRTRMMSQNLSLDQKVTIEGGKSSALIYKSSINCLLETIRHENIGALYKGFLPAWLRMTPWNLIFFTTYEKLNKMF